MVFSGGKIESLEPFVDVSVWPKFELSLLYYSAESPRNLIRLLDHIISEVCELDIHPSIITESALQSGIDHFQSIRNQEFDSKEYTQKLNELEQNDNFRLLFPKLA